jgi:type II secretory pathway predicted ATPase ExeA
MIDKLQAHYGFTRMPFGRDLAPGMLHRHAAQRSRRPHHLVHRRTLDRRHHR